MSNNLKQVESKFLERARTALTNAENHEEIKTSLADYGMDAAKVAEGTCLYQSTKSIWDLNQKEEAETKIASNSYKGKYNKLSSRFKRRRDHTLIFFKKEPDVLVTLGVKGRFPGTYNDFFDKTEQFYTGIQANPAIQTKMDVIKITSAVVADCLTLHK